MPVLPLERWTVADATDADGGLQLTTFSKECAGQIVCRWVSLRCGTSKSEVCCRRYQLAVASSKYHMYAAMANTCMSSAVYTSIYGIIHPSVSTPCTCGQGLHCRIVSGCIIASCNGTVPLPPTDTRSAQPAQQPVHTY